MSDGRSWAVAVRNPVKDPDAIVDPDVRAQTLRTITASPYPAYRARRSAWSPATFMVALAALVVAGSVLFAVTRQGTIGGLPGAATALANVIESRDTVLHVVTREPDDVPNAAEGGSRITATEQWMTIDSRTTGVSRVLTRYANGSFEDMRTVLQRKRYRISVYRSKDNTLTIEPWLRNVTKKTPAGELVRAQADAFVNAVRNGTATLDGETDVDGVPAYRIVAKDPGSGPKAWYISRDEHSPRLLRVESGCGGTKERPQCPVTTFEVYETINDRSVLKLPARPGQKVIRRALERRP
ncbi:hypothetical protein [Patulibacter defluvii]|uniref:hypothetical protein n=1 Tax=Patulibacter defluvii TaxID=3095358 RepID=UPI002A7641C7|nr:hypothetical protein [Patulibacter sp. DM4]